MIMSVEAGKRVAFAQQPIRTVSCYHTGFSVVVLGRDHA
jgi:hypothetical protein